MKVTLEPFGYVMRFHPDDDAVLGDPYTFAATLIVNDDKIGNIQGLSSETSEDTYTIAMWKAADKALGEIGVKEVLWYRKVRGKITRIFRKVGNGF